MITIKYDGGSVTIADGEVNFSTKLLEPIAKSYSSEYAFDVRIGEVSRHEDHDKMLAMRVQADVGGELDMTKHVPPPTDTTGGIVY